MLHLMRFELIKFKLWPIIRGAFIAICDFSLLVILLMFDGEFTHYDEVFRFIDIFMRGIYIIFGASLIAKFIQEFQTKTMPVMFMYPINRKKMRMAKICIIMIVTLLLILISEGIVFCLFLYIEFI
ncbi:hypothetical protein ACRS6Y_07405 [Bacillus cytotoxicus]|uniref:hypothetical protein n=2 Tax=Bacillus cytotoxicus TaxID=580165 RepID=UPI001F46A594|nr:hypothetical protein [Bacillus cytotoxicus]